MVEADPQKIASGGVPLGPAVDNDRARQWLAGNLSEKSYADYNETNRDLTRVVSATNKERVEHKIDISTRLSEKSGLPYPKV